MVTYKKIVEYSTDDVDDQRYEFMGLSTDEKLTDVGVNSLFIELDIGDAYYFDENWQKVGS